MVMVMVMVIVIGNGNGNIMVMVMVILMVIVMVMVMVMVSNISQMINMSDHCEQASTKFSSQKSRKSSETLRCSL